jgi:hypothetical protein
LFIAIHIGPGKTGTTALQYDTTRHLLNTLFQQEKEYIMIKTKSIFPLEKETEIFLLRSRDVYRATTNYTQTVKSLAAFQ